MYELIWLPRSNHHDKVYKKACAALQPSASLKRKKTLTDFKRLQIYPTVEQLHSIFQETWNIKYRLIIQAWVWSHRVYADLIYWAGAAEAVGGTAEQGTLCSGWELAYPCPPLDRVKAEPDPLTAELKHHPIVCTAAHSHKNCLKPSTWQPFDMLWVGFVPHSLRGECNTLRIIILGYQCLTML